MGGLALAIGGPIGYFSADEGLSTAKQWFSSLNITDTARQMSPFGTDPAAAAPEGVSAPALNVSPHGTTLAGLDEVLRFDATVDWIMRRWPRVSTGMPHPQLQGYRVSLVSGTNLGDVAGSLTYFFNARQQVQRITLRGTTGDPGALASLLASRFHFVRRLTNDPGLVCYESVDSHNRTNGTLKIRTAHTIDASRPYTRFEVDLVIDRPEW